MAFLEGIAVFPANLLNEETKQVLAEESLHKTLTLNFFFALAPHQGALNAGAPPGDFLSPFASPLTPTFACSKF